MLQMPKPDESVLSRRNDIVAALRAIVPGEGVIVQHEEMRAYETDALTAYRQVPMVVVLPTTTEQISKILKYCNEAGVKVVPRGAGTSLSGGALPLADGILLGGTFERGNWTLEPDQEAEKRVLEGHRRFFEAMR